MFDLSILPDNLRAKAEALGENIVFEKLIDKGANGYVLIGQNTLLGRRVAIKFYYWGNGDHAEPARLAKLASEHVLEVHHAESIDDEYAYFMTPFCDQGDLDDSLLVKKFGLIEALDVVLQVASGASYLHGCQFLHRDLKPSNIFCMADGKYVIGDFGSVVSKNVDGYAQTLTRHSLLYRPPEELQEGRSYPESDIYQIGIVLFQLLGGHLPYGEAEWLRANELKTYNALTGFEQQKFATEIIERKIRAGKIVDINSLPSWVPFSIKSIIRRCCHLDRGRRFESAATLIAKLNNIRSTLPDWRVEGHPTLYRNNKIIRIVGGADECRLEKRSVEAANWRSERQLKPVSLAEAVFMAEQI